VRPAGLRPPLVITLQFNLPQPHTPAYGAHHQRQIFDSNMNAFAQYPALPGRTAPRISSSVCANPTPRCNRIRMGVHPPSIHQPVDLAFAASNAFLASTLDVGPVSVQGDTLVLVAAIAGGILVASLVAFVLVRF